MSAEIIRKYVSRYRSGYSLEQPFYTNQEVFDFEWHHIWKKYWLFAGTTADIPRPGDYQAEKRLPHLQPQNHWDVVA